MSRLWHTQNRERMRVKDRTNGNQTKSSDGTIRESIYYKNLKNEMGEEMSYLDVTGQCVYDKNVLEKTC